MLLSRCLLHFPDRWLALEFLSEGLLLGESKLSQDPVATYWMMDKYMSWTSQCHCFALTATIIPEMSWTQVANGVSADSETHLPSVPGTPGFVPRLFPVSLSYSSLWPSQVEKMLSAMSLGPSLTILLGDPSCIKKETSLHYLFQRLPPLHLLSLMTL